jgi:hypothetical protein
MGVDARITFMPDVRVKDAAMVMGVLAGLTPERYSLGRDDAVFVKVPGVTVKPTMIPEMAEISLAGRMVDGEADHTAYWHFESADGTSLCAPRSTPFWIAVAHGLVDFFGGSIDYQDCDGGGADIRRDSPFFNHPTDGAAWDEFQLRILNLAPLTRQDLYDAMPVAAYGLSNVEAMARMADQERAQEALPAPKSGSCDS